MIPQYTAQRLSQFGRGGDTTLMHVQPAEMQGIATLLGRPLTQNPATGLPEAFNLKSILPIVAGLGGTLVGGPMVGAAAAGATKTATTGDLQQGILTGLTSYATGSLLSDVGAAGNLAQGTAAMSGVPANALTNATGAVTNAAGYGSMAQNAIDAAGAAQAASIMPQVSAAAMPPHLQAATAAGNAGFGNLQSGALTGVRDAFSAQPIGERLGDIGRGLTDPSALMGVARQSPLMALGAAGGAMMTMQDMAPPPPTTEPQRANYAPIRPRNSWMPPPVGYNSQPGSGFIRNFAQGGVASLDGGRMQSLPAAKNLVDEATAALLGEHPRPQDAIRRFEETFGPAMLEALRDRIAGGRVQGAGGGLDDLVPGSIEGRQAVRLADGEFVVPSDIVSALGDGSTDQGSRKLHEMMDRVRKAKTGSTEQPGPIEDDEVLPA